MNWNQVIKSNFQEEIWKSERVQLAFKMAKNMKMMMTWRMKLRKNQIL